MTYHQGVGSGVTQRSQLPITPPKLTAPIAPLRLVATPGVMAPAAPTALPMSKAEGAAALAARTASAPTPYRAGAAERPTSIVTAECADYRYVVGYRPMDRAGIVRAGTPVVAGRKISWNPSIVGADFPRSWVDWRNHNAGTSQLVVDTNTRTSRPGLPATSSALLTAETKCFLIGFKLLGPNEGVLYVGAVSTRDVDTEKMQYFLKDMLRTPARVEPLWPASIAYAAVPPIVPGAASVFYPPITESVARPELIGSRYSIHTAKEVAISAAIALKEALVAMISGEIFGSMSVSASPPLVIPGEREVLAAIAAIQKAGTLADLPPSLSTTTAALIAEAEAAKSMDQAEGDAAVAGILTRLASMQSAVMSELEGAVAALSAGVAALPGAQAAASAFTSRASNAQTEIQRLVQDKINSVESKPAFTRLSPGEQHAVHCIMLNKAAPLIAARAAVAQPRIDLLVSIPPADFASVVASANASYGQAIAAAAPVFADALAKVEAIRAQIALDWFSRDFHGLPVWAWGAGGAVLLLGGAVIVRKMSKKAAA